ncbi:hypothetical protein WMF27_32620 [Sorangium sp. So ce281]
MADDAQEVVAVREGVIGTGALGPQVAASMDFTVACSTPSSAAALATAAFSASA